MPSVRDRAGNVDGLPNVLLEALAAGRAIVATRVAGIPDVIRDDVNGLLVPERDPLALALALERLAREPGTRQRLGEAARRTREETLTWGAAISAFEEGLCRSGGAGRPLGAPATASTSRGSGPSSWPWTLPHAPPSRSAGPWASSKRPRARPLCGASRDPGLRLDRIGDVLMCLPALQDLRAAAPRAPHPPRGGPLERAHRPELPRGRGPGVERPLGGTALGGRRFVLRAPGRQGPRAPPRAHRPGPRPPGRSARVPSPVAVGAERRVGYANTGAGLPAHGRRAPRRDGLAGWSRTVARWPSSTGREPGPATADPLTPADRAFAQAFLHEEGLLDKGPLVGLHPSGGRRIKEWPLERWRARGGALAARARGRPSSSRARPRTRPRAAPRRGPSRPPPSTSRAASTCDRPWPSSRVSTSSSPPTPDPCTWPARWAPPRSRCSAPRTPVRYFTGGAFDGHARAARGRAARPVVRAAAT